MPSVFREILEETLRFRAVLPELLPHYAGKWVLFKDGRVASIHTDEDDACRAGRHRYGSESYVVDRVEEKRPEPLSAAVVYG